MNETQQRFLKAISERITSGDVEEVRLYPTVRAGHVESGVAIVAVRDLVIADPSSGADAPAAIEAAAEDANAEPTEDPAVAVRSDRLSILTAHFRHQVKGSERGKWEFEMVHDADAPIETIERVVRGVAHRSGEDGEPELLTGDEFRRALTEPWWTEST